MAVNETVHRSPRRQYVESVEDDLSIRDSASVTGIRALVLDDNIECLIDNPLLHWRPGEVEDNVRRFARDFGLENQYNTLLKAARILRDPEAWSNVPDLKPDEIEALEAERTSGFWRQPKELKVTIITLCAAAVLQGWNQTGSNGANLHWPDQFGLANVLAESTNRDTWIFAIVNASTYLSASLIGCWLSDPINEYFFGRRAAVCISAFIIAASVVGGALTQTWQQLLVCRILLGIGMGAKASVVPVFAAEVAPAHIRGALVMNWQVFDAFGIFLGFSANLVASTVGPAAWRWQTASSLLPCIVVLSLIWTIPESPRFKMKHDKYREAYKILLALRGERILAAKEILYIHYQMEIEMQLLSRNGVADLEKRKYRRPKTPGSKKGKKHRVKEYMSYRRTNLSINYWQKIGQLFTNKRIRRAMLSAAIPMLTQQLCGTNVLQFYSSTIFSTACGAKSPTTTHSPATAHAYKTYRTPLLLSWGIGLSNFVFAFPAYWLIDSRGRRWLLLVTLPFLALFLLASSLSFSLPCGDHNDPRGPVLALFVYIFQFFYAWGVGPVPFTMAAEVFPLENRVVGMSFSVFVNLFGAGLLTLLVPALTSKLGPGALLGIFAGLNVLAFVLVFLFVRETAGAAIGGTPGSMTFMSLEELNYIFGVGVSKHIQYQVKVVVPWAWQRYVKRDPSCPDQPPKLYTWANANVAQREVVVAGTGEKL